MPLGLKWIILEKILECAILSKSFAGICRNSSFANGLEKFKGEKILMEKMIEASSHDKPNNLILYSKQRLQDVVHYCTEESSYNPSILLPIRKNMANPWAIRQLENFFKILLRYFKRFCGDIGNVLSDQLAGVDTCLLDLF